MREREMSSREVLANTPECTASEKTRAGYLVLVRRLVDRTTEHPGNPISMRKLLEVAKDTTKLNTWYRRKAALTHWARCQLALKLQELDKLQRDLPSLGKAVDPNRNEGLQHAVMKASGFASMLSQLKKEKPPEFRERRHSKRQDMKKLPADWREQLLQRCEKYQHAALVNAVTGCRPDELERGVRLAIVDGYLVAEIMGSKVTANSGQPWRRMIWAPDSASSLVHQLREKVMAGLAFAEVSSAKTYSGALRAAGKRQWPKRDRDLSPYCFRHQFAADMKANGRDDDEISQALGHCVNKAKTYYGCWQQGNKAGGVMPAIVQAARPVKAARVRQRLEQKEDIGYSMDSP